MESNNVFFVAQLETPTTTKPNRRGWLWDSCPISCFSCYGSSAQPALWCVSSLRRFFSCRTLMKPHESFLKRMFKHGSAHVFFSNHHPFGLIFFWCRKPSDSNWGCSSSPYRMSLKICHGLMDRMIFASLHVCDLVDQLPLFPYTCLIRVYIRLL